jgi:hypothetical protein
MFEEYQEQPNSWGLLPGELGTTDYHIWGSRKSSVERYSCSSCISFWKSNTSRCIVHVDAESMTKRGSLTGVQDEWINMWRLVGKRAYSRDLYLSSQAFCNYLVISVIRSHLVLVIQVLFLTLQITDKSPMWRMSIMAWGMIKARSSTHGTHCTLYN